MSFTPKTLERIGGGLSGSQGTFNYMTQDSIASVEVSGYFDEANIVRLNDYLVVFAIDGANTYRVTGIDPTILEKAASTVSTKSVTAPYIALISDEYLRVTNAGLITVPLGRLNPLNIYASNGNVTTSVVTENRGSLIETGNTFTLIPITTTGYYVA